MYLNLANWKTEKGWCIDHNGKEGGRGKNKKGLTKRECFALCEKSSSLNGCTFYEPGGDCITYSGNIVKGNGSPSYQCFYRFIGNQINFSEIINI